MAKSWTNIGKVGHWTERQIVICRYVKDGVRRFRPVANTGSLEEADYICKVFTEQYENVPEVEGFETFTDYVHHNTQVNDGFLSKLIDEDTTIEVLKKIYQYEEEQKAEYAKAMGLRTTTVSTEVKE